MISRVAECCFWLHRYIERAETSARFAHINRFIVLDADLSDAERWKPVVIVMGEQKGFEEALGVDAYDDDDSAEQYLTWDERNPVSISSSMHWARENARMIREVISREMWETINECYQWLGTKSARRLYENDRAQFYGRVRSTCAEFQGVCHSTMLHEEPFDFMRLGMLLERANQTARVMDVKHHWIAGDPSPGHTETPREAAQWTALLRLCVATEPFFKHARSVPNGARVAEFLLKEQAFPRAVLHCLDRACNFLNRIEQSTGRKTPSDATKLVREAVRRVQTRSIEQVLSDGLHEELTYIIETVSETAESMAREFF